MKTFILVTTLLITGFCQASQNTSKVFVFQFKTIKAPIQAKASSKEEAFRVASKECFNKLTGGKYPGEEKGLDIIDICANPKM